MWRQKNPDKVRFYRQNHAEDYRLYMREYMRRYRQEHKSPADPPASGNSL